ncbi:MAG TPA: TIM-barrel domain-containing protein [Longimicrobiales bacterium]|nr:TIM-barrel domain-containing protein [Longimicrobiales bacterium]
MARRSESTEITRRDAIRQMGAASAGMLLAGPAVRWHSLSLRVQNRAVDVVAAAVSPATMRISVLAAGDRPAQPIPLDGGALVASDWAPQASIAAGDSATVGTFRVRVDADPVRLVISRSDGTIIQEIEVDEATGSASFEMGRRPLLGMGQGGPQFDRRGASYTMRWGQGGYQLRTHGGVVPIQWLVSTDGWALWIHQPLGTLDLTGERGVFNPPEDSPLPLDMFVVDSADPVEIMGEWARLTGQPEMPPLWSFGYQQSHRTLAGPEEVLQVAEAFREKRLPCDTLIYLGTGFTPAGWNTQNGEFRWNPVTFPDPDAVLEQLRALNYRVVLHVVLEGRRLSGAVDDPCPNPPAPGETGSGRTWPEEQQVSCYWPIHDDIIEQGIDGFWPDQGDGLDAESRMNRIRMYWDGMRAARPDERMFALHRNGQAGMARYAPFLWSGDVYTTWETLRTHVSVAINTGLSGIPYWGTDIGGFVPTPEYTGELHVRWFQFGAFCPLFRAHGRTWHLRLPWGWNTGQLGHDELSNYRGGAGYSDPSELNNPDVEPACRKYLELRYRLMPYLYTAVRETHDRGLPIMRSLWLHYPDDELAAARGDEYLWGRDILVAPVVEPGVQRRRLYLPRGLWYDFWTEEPVHGGREIAREVDLETTPLYVRAGAVIPMGPVKQYTAEPVDEPVTLVVHPGADGESFMYEDDGHTFGYQRGEWMRIVMQWTDAERRLALRLDDGSGRRGPLPRTFRVRVAGETAVSDVTFDGNPTEITV